jgi:hypothetical protein
MKPTAASGGKPVSEKYHTNECRLHPFWKSEFAILFSEESCFYTAVGK